MVNLDRDVKEIKLELADLTARIVVLEGGKEEVEEPEEKETKKKKKK